VFTFGHTLLLKSLHLMTYKMHVEKKVIFLLSLFVDCRLAVKHTTKSITDEHSFPVTIVLSSVKFLI